MTVGSVAGASASCDRPRRLILVAAGGLAREVLALVRAHGPHAVTGFLDDDLDMVGQEVDGVRVVGRISEASAHPDAEFLVCTGRGSARAAIVGRLAAHGVGADRYATVIHPKVEVPIGCAVGRGSIVLAGAVLTAGVTIGEHVVVMPHVTLPHDVVVEDFATLCAGVTLGGGVVVGRCAYVGMSSSVREHLRIGADTTLGMGAALLRDLPPGQTWAGVPARPLLGQADRNLEEPRHLAAGTNRMVDP